MPALPVIPLAASDLIQNGGQFFVQAGPAEGIYAFPSTDAYPVEGGAAQPVYVVSAAEVAAGRPVIWSRDRIMKQVARASRPLIGGAARPVYLLGGAFDPTTTLAYSDKLLALFGSAIVAYWPQWEPSGAVSTDIGPKSHPGAYTAVALGQTGIGDGRTAALYDGTTSFDNVFSAGLNTDFNNQEGSLLLWGQMANAGVWTDATVRRLAFLRADASNNINIGRTATNNQLVVTYLASGSSSSVNIATAAPLTFFHVGLTWSKSANQMIAYYLGVQSGATQAVAGVWAGSLSAAFCNIGAGSTAPVAVFSGALAHCLLLNRPATAAEMAIAATVP